MGRYQGLTGVVVLLGIAWLMSNNRRKISLRIVVWGLALQFTFAFLTLRTQAGLRFFQVCDVGVNKLLEFSEAGSDFVFRSYVTDKVEAPLVNFAFHTLPTVIFFSALLSVLYHLGIMQLVVKGMAWVMVRTMGTSGAETLSVTGDIFVGQTEAPLLIRPFLPSLTKSELMTVMCGGFATIAGGVMAVYVGMLKDSIPGIAGHLMAASVMCAPSAIVIAKIIWPETVEPQTRGTLHVPVERHARNSLEAVAEGATDGMKLSLNIAAMLIAFVAMVAFINAILGWGPTIAVPSTSLTWTVPATSLQEIFGWLFRPLAWVLGVNWGEAETLGMLLGERLVLTELFAYAHLGKMETGAEFSERSAVIASYALCGFANFASIGIQMGGIGALAPERKPDLAELALKAMIAGTLATCMTAAIAGVLIDVQVRPTPDGTGSASTDRISTSSSPSGGSLTCAGMVLGGFHDPRADRGRSSNSHRILVHATGDPQERPQCPPQLASRHRKTRTRGRWNSFWYCCLQLSSPRSCCSGSSS